MRNLLPFLLLLLQQVAWAQTGTRQISLNDALADSAILFNKYDNLVVITGWQEGMHISFDRCTVQQVNGDTFNVRANFTGTDALVVKKGDRAVYTKSYKVLSLSYASASVSISMLPGVEATTAQILESLTPAHKSAGDKQSRIIFMPKKGDPTVIEIVGKGKNNPDVRAMCDRMQKGDKVIIEFPKYPAAAKTLTLK